MTLAPPEATLAITPTCPHCPTMMEILGELVKQGETGSLHIVNIVQHSDFARDHHIRSVPWLKIGPFVLQGLHSKQEIQTWIARSQSEAGIMAYFSELLSTGELNSVSHSLALSPDLIRLFIPLLSSEETNINVRLGMAAILEDLAGQAILDNLLEGLLTLLKHENARVRGDAAHFLSFLKSTNAVTALQECLNDPNSEVREIAQESLEAISAN